MLSNQERQRLAAIERQLLDDDPKFVRRFEYRMTVALRDESQGRPTTGRRIGSLLGALAFLIGGPWASSVPPDAWDPPGGQC